MRHTTVVNNKPLKPSTVKAMYKWMTDLDRAFHSKNKAAIRFLLDDFKLMDYDWSNPSFPMEDLADMEEWKARAEQFLNA